MIVKVYSINMLGSSIRLGLLVKYPLEPFDVYLLKHEDMNWGTNSKTTIVRVRGSSSLCLVFFHGSRSSEILDFYMEHLAQHGEYLKKLYRGRQGDS